MVDLSQIVFGFWLGGGGVILQRRLNTDCGSEERHTQSRWWADCPDLARPSVVSVLSIVALF